MAEQVVLTELFPWPANTMNQETFGSKFVSQFSGLVDDGGCLSPGLESLMCRETVPDLDLPHPATADQYRTPTFRVCPPAPTAPPSREHVRCTPAGCPELGGHKERYAGLGVRHNGKVLSGKRRLFAPRPGVKIPTASRHHPVPPPLVKARRRQYTAEQQLVLQNKFANSPYCCRRDRDQLASQLQLSPQAIMVS